jgi:hypothetical protein
LNEIVFFPPTCNTSRHGVGPTYLSVQLVRGVGWEIRQAMKLSDLHLIWRLGMRRAVPPPPPTFAFIPWCRDTIRTPCVLHARNITYSFMRREKMKEK